MRFLFSCWPFDGHVFPQMSIALSLRAAGHDVAFYTGSAAAKLIEPEGVEVYPFRRLGDSRYVRVQEQEAATGGRRQSLRVEHRAFRDWLVETIPDQVADLRAVMLEWSPDVIVSDLSMWGAALVLSDLGPVPVVASSTLMGPMTSGRDAPAWGFGMRPPRDARGRLTASVLNGLTSLVATGLRRRVNELRAGYGLGPLGLSINDFCGRLPLYLVPSLPELDYGRADLPRSVHYVGPCVWDPPVSQGESRWLDDVPTDLPWVHVTEGTSHHQEPFLLKAAVGGLGDQRVRVLATTGRARDPAELALGALAPNIHLTRWLSHRHLLPRCSVVVTTGGPATIMAALQAGVPLVVVPTTWDKPDNARRVEDAGVGIRLRSGRCSPQRLREAVRQVLDDPRFGYRARTVADSLAAAPGPSRSAELLEELALHTKKGSPWAP